MPEWLERRYCPGAWPPAELTCGDPKNLEFDGNTRLAPDRPDRACAKAPACAAVLGEAGPRPDYRHRLGLR